MTTIDKIADILAIVLAIIYVTAIIIILIINLKPLFNPKKYYLIEYIFDYKGKTEIIIKARTPEQAIRKLIRMYPRRFPLNSLTDITSCKEVDFYKCLKEVPEDE
jgi:hypothetical protein